MLSLRVSLSRFQHCFLQILCFTVLVLGEVDRAFINVIAQSEDGQNSSFANLAGRFARIGAIKQVDGELKEIDSCDPEDPDQDVDEMQQFDETQSWIGVIHIPVLEYYNAHGSKSCSVLERVRKAMFLGASAIIIITLNQNVLKKLDLGQMLSRPIIALNGTGNVSKLMDALRRVTDFPHAFNQPNTDKIQCMVHQMKTKATVVNWKLLSTLTLWATCGRPSGWEGVVCLGNPEKGAEGVNSQFTGSSAFFASVLFCLLVFKTQLSQLLHNYWISKKEEMLRQEAAEAVAKLQTRKYRRAVRDSRPCCSSSTCSKQHGKEKRESELCAVCLDEFLNNQLVRTLPCDHEFHCECVDRWLLAKRTCPLCKRNILESLSLVKSRDQIERSNASESGENGRGHRQRGTRRASTATHSSDGLRMAADSRTPNNLRRTVRTSNL